MPRAIEVGAGQVTAGAGRRHLGHPIDVEVAATRPRPAAPESAPRWRRLPAPAPAPRRRRRAPACCRRPPACRARPACRRRVPATSAATSACSSATSVPETFRKRAIGCLFGARGLARAPASASTSAGAAAWSRCRHTRPATSESAAADTAAMTRGLRARTGGVTRSPCWGERRPRRSGAAAFAPCVCVARAGAQAGNRRLDGVAHQRVGVFVRHQAARQAQQHQAEDRRQHQPQRHVDVERRREQARVDAALHPRADRVLDLHHEGEPLGLAGDAGHAAIQEHQREVLRLALAELVEAPRRPCGCRPAGRRSARRSCCAAPSSRKPSSARAWKMSSFDAK